MSKHIATHSESDQPILGQLLSSATHEPLGGFQVAIQAEAGDKVRELGAAFSQLDGVFSIPLSPQHSDGLARSEERFTLVVRNRFSRVVHRSQALPGRRLLEPLDISVQCRDEDDHPLPRSRPDPFEAFRETFEVEAAVLRRAGIDTFERLLDLDLGVFSRQHELSHERLVAFRLAADAGAPEQLSGNDARLLAAAGITTTDELALRPAAYIYRAVRRAAEQVSFKVEPVDASRVADWQMAARGWRTNMLRGHLDQVALAASFQPVADKLRALNPGSFINLVTGQWARMQAIGEMRAIMEAGGVYDLSGLGSFRVKGPHRIDPGYHIAAPKTVLSKVGAIGHLNRLLAQGGGFAKVATSSFLGDHLHILPNPVQDAIIIGSVVDFLEDGKLIVGRKVAKLTVITEEIRFGVVNSIEYEGSGDIPQTPAKRPDRPQVSRRPDQGPTQSLNNRMVYTHRGDTHGRDGLRGPDGADGRPGHNAEVAPSVTLFVKNLPAGLPNINLGGRRGGRGQDGQDGGHGEDGARGRESESGFLACFTNVGNGGKGGDGGNGGKPGRGGNGGSGGSINVFTTPENLPHLLARPGVSVLYNGGPRGDEGVGGAAGDEGKGGWVGRETGWCDADDGHAGEDGKRGAVGKRDKDDPVGTDGAAGNNSSVQPITEDDWNAAFTQPYLLRLEPSSGHAGQQIHVVGINFTSLTKLMFDGQSLSPDSVDVPHNTMKFTVPNDATGGVKIVSLWVPPATNPKLRELSNAVNFRVLPRLSAVMPARGLPGTVIRLQGGGFSAGANVQFADRVFLANLNAGNLQLKLPDFDVIAMSAGPKSVVVVNPDGETSNPMSFELETEIVVRIKAWRVLDSEDDGTGRDDDDIREIFDHERSPAAIWGAHGIRLDFDRNIGVARVSSDLADTWPEGNTPESESAKQLLLTPTGSDEKYFVPGAINFYFVNDIDNCTDHAYAGLGSAETPNPPPVVIFEDTGMLTVEEEAHVAAHEIGHVFGLPHICANKEDDAPETTTGRVCEEGADEDYLMFPRINPFTTDGNAMTSGEVKLAKSFALNLHPKAP